MLNIDSRLMELIPEIGAETFVALCVIANRMNKDNVAFPSKSLLQKETGFGRDKLTKLLHLLEKNGLISIEQTYEGNLLGNNHYTVKTDYISVFTRGKKREKSNKASEVVGNQSTENQFAENQILCAGTENQLTENQSPVNQLTVNQIQSINHSEVLNVLSINSPETSSGINENQKVQISEDQILTKPKQKSASKKEKVARAAIHIKPAKPKTDGSKVWDYYETAFIARYRVEPIRNAKVNSICSSIAKSIPLEASQGIVNYYLSCNDSWYKSKGHPLEFLLKDLQKLQIELATGRKLENGYKNRNQQSNFDDLDMAEVEKNMKVTAKFFDCELDEKWGLVSAS